MSTNHTPGPWIASGNRVYMGAAMERREIAVTTKSDPVIRHVAEANARLIAAAPDMLAVLHRFARAMEQHSYPELQGAACEAWAVIAKAEGKVT